MKPRKHAEIIKAWAEGHKIQYRRNAESEWVDCEDPAWMEDYEYRLNPSQPKQTYPEESRSVIELEELLEKFEKKHPSFGVWYFATSVIAHAIDNGQVVPREEFDSAIGDRKTRDRAVAMNVRDAAARLFPSCTQAASSIEMLNLAAIIAEVKP